MTTRTTVLLGAGASKESGLMLASELSAHLVRQLNEKSMQTDGLAPWLRALNFTYGALLSHSSGEGHSPLEGVDIERLVSALRLLQQRQNHEAAPFVSLWKEGVKGFRGPQLPVERHEKLLEALHQALDIPAKDTSRRPRPVPKWAKARPLTQQIGIIARQATRPPSADVFKEAENQLLRALTEHLESFQEVNYLDPLAVTAERTGYGLDVLTLNYDTTVEVMARARGLTVETGLLNWAPGHKLNFDVEESKIRLYKLHGSIDWEYRQGDNTAQPPQIVSRTSEGVDDEQQYEYEPAMPWVVVGDREKLSTDGPTLPLLRAAEHALAMSGRLVVVGYSFGDDHINFMIRNWMAGDRNRELRIVDPGWTVRSAANSFKEDLLTHYIKDPDPGWGSRVQIFRGTTQEMLEPALAESLHASGAEAFDIKVIDVTEGGVEVFLKYLGPGLSSLLVTAVQKASDDPVGYGQRGVSYADNCIAGRRTSLGLPEDVRLRNVVMSHEMRLSIEREGPGALYLELTAFPHNLSGPHGWQERLELVIPQD